MDFKRRAQQGYNPYDDTEVCYYDDFDDDSLYFEVKENPLTNSPKYFSMRAASFNSWKPEEFNIPISNDKTNGMFVEVKEHDKQHTDEPGPDGLNDWWSYIPVSYLGLTKDGDTYIAPARKAEGN